MSPSGSASGTAPARAALAGNPSDGYGGAVLALCLPALRARVRVAPARGWDVRPAAAAPLVRAAAARFGRWHRRDPDAAGPLQARVHTTIPREVGLAGSSAIVVATLRALGALHGAPIGVDELPEVALAAETEELGIAAGLQDRVAQARGGLVFMDFAQDAGRPAVQELAPALLPDLLVAWRASQAAPSGVTHAGLRERAAAEPALVRAAMARLAAHARAGRDALRAGDAAALRAAMDGSLDERASLVELDPRHVAMVEAFRACGGSANYTGSGGAVVGVVPDPRRRADVLARLAALGCGTLQVAPGEPDRRESR
jgi:glucuronokinase